MITFNDFLLIVAALITLLLVTFFVVILFKIFINILITTENEPKPKK